MGRKKMRRDLLAAVFLSVFGLVQGAFGQELGAIRIPRDAELAPFGLTRAWWAQATLDFGRDSLQFFTSDEQETFAQAATGMVTAIDNPTGRRLWSVQVGAHTDTRFQLVTNEREALIVSGDKCYALDKKTGNVRWELPTPSAPSTGPSMDAMQVYLGGSKGYVNAYSAKLLDEYSENSQMAEFGHRVHRWDFRAGGRILYPAVTTGSIVYVVSSDRYLYGLNAADRKVLFIFETDGRATAPMTYTGNHIFAVSDDLKLYCLDANKGALQWEKVIGHYMFKPPIGIGEHVFVCPERDGMHCFEVANGREVWMNRGATAFLAATPTVVYASDYVGDVLVLNRADGRTIGSLSVQGFPIRIANDRTDRLYFASPGGLMLCIREREREFPLFHRVPEQQPVVPGIAPDQPAEKTGAAAKPKAEKKKEADESSDDKSDDKDKDKGADDKDK
jgi:outer membrane protein assembly factor BamB